MKNWTDPFLVCYDVTRLVERMHAGHSTGVDRVDLHYALWTRARASEWQGVVQRSNGFVVLKGDEVDALLKHLSGCWLGVGEGPEALALKQPSGWRRESRMALREKLLRRSFGAVWAERGIATALWSRLPRFSVSPASPSLLDGPANTTYVNVGYCMRFESALASIPDETRRIYFLHDVIPLTHPETQKATTRAHFRTFCNYVGHPMSNMIVSSQATLDAIAALPNKERQQLNTVASINVLPLAVEERFAKRSGGITKGNEEIRYFLSVGPVEPRKNLDLLVRVWEQLIEAGAVIPKLIWVGKFAWSCDKQLMRRFEYLQKQGHVELRSGVEDADLLDLIAGAIALLFPSKVEGWGLPLSEALAMGLPVIASDIPVFREVGQGIPELLELEKLESWKRMILSYTAVDSKHRAQQMRHLENYQPVTWPRHFEQLEALLD